MKRRNVRLSLSRETLRTLADGDGSLVNGGATTICRASGCVNCGTAASCAPTNCGTCSCFLTCTITAVCTSDTCA